MNFIGNLMILYIVQIIQLKNNIRRNTRIKKKFNIEKLIFYINYIL